eukprot:Gb_01428 [translate_table: standard]
MACLLQRFVCLFLKSLQFELFEPVTSVWNVRSTRSSKGFFIKEASAGACLSRYWFGYLLMLSWAAISAATETSLSSSVLFSHHKSAVSSILPMVSLVKGHGREHFPSHIPPPYAHPAAAPAGSTPPLPMFRPPPAQSPVLSHHSHAKQSAESHVESPFLTPLLPPRSGNLNTHSDHSYASSSLSTPSARSSQSSAPVPVLLPQPRLISAPPPSILTSITSKPPPPYLSPHVSGCCKSNMMWRPGSDNCSCVYPIRLQLRFVNVSTSFTNQSAEFQQELASQLGLTVAQFDITSFYFDNINELNMSMDIAPLTGISFSYREAHRINYTLAMHKVHLNSSFFGDYKLQNFTWLQPPALPPAIPTAAPTILPEASLPSPFPGRRPPAAKSRGKSPSLFLIVSIAAGIIAIIFVSMLIIWKCTSNQCRKTNRVLKGKVKSRPADALSNDGSLPRPTSTRFFAYEELKEATNNFEIASVLGEGGFGRVFKGVLKDGTSVAIKKLSSGGHQGDREFLVEVEMLSRLHHRNLVKLVGYYSSRDSSQHLLCYELVPNGSLEAWLHGPLGANHPLDWDSRMKIALDAARGLAYLHEDSQPCVIHRDFKASNILLENNFHAKVADFGLAKQAPEGRGNYLSTRVMGTFGYVAPEYAMTGHLLVKSDVYSYGVVLLELLSGRKPVDMSQPSGQENLVTWARPILRDKDRLEELADPRLDGKYPKDDFVQVCAIAAACVAPEASQRPTMGEVVQSLKMVQRTSEYHQSGERDGFTDTLTNSNRPHTPSGRNIRPSSTTFESDGSSSIFSSGPFSGLSGIDNDNLSRTAVFSEDLQEGR